MMHAVLAMSVSEYLLGVHRLRWPALAADTEPGRQGDTLAPGGLFRFVILLLPE